MSRDAGAQALLYEGSLRYSSGSYGLDGTVRSGFLLSSLTWSSRRWYAEVTVPVIWQDSADVRYVGGMPMPVDGHRGSGETDHHPGHPGHPGEPEPPPEDASDTAVGDPYLRVGMDVYRNLAGAGALGVFGTVKLPVADESRGFGTGEWDVGAGVEWTHRRASGFFRAEGSYWVLGEPTGEAFENPLAGELSYGRYLGGGRHLLEATLWGRTKTAEGVEGPLALDLTFHRSLGGSQSVFVTAEAGLTESSPDYSVSFGYRTRLWER